MSLAALGAAAQENNGNLASRSMTVEGDYSADVTEADKIMPVPSKPEVQSSKSTAVYWNVAHQYEGWNRGPMSVMAEKTGEKGLSALAEANIGTLFDADAMLDIRYDMSDKVQLFSNGGFVSWNGGIGPDSWNSKMFDLYETLGLSVSTDKLKFSILGDFGHAAFNCMPIAGLSNDRKYGTGGIKARVASSFGDKFDFDATVGFSHTTDKQSFMDGSENLWRFDGNVVYRYLPDISILMDVASKIAVYDYSSQLTSKVYSNYSYLSLTPYMFWNIENLELNAGANLHIQKEFSPHIQASPYIIGRYRITPSISAMARATGGVQDYDFRALHAVSPYWASASQISDGYENMNASLGIEANAFGHYSFAVIGGSRHISDMLLMTAFDDVANGLAVSKASQADATSAYAEASAHAVYTDRIDAQLSFGLYKWDADDALLLEMLPDMKLSFKASSRVYKDLYAVGSFCYARYTECSGTRLECMKMLDLGLRYKISKSLSVMLDGNNLLNSEHFRFAAYQMLPRTVSAGISYRF